MFVRLGVLAPGLGRKDHDLAHGMIIMVRLWLTHNILYSMYGIWYFGELTKIFAYGFMFKVSGTSEFKEKGPS